MIYTFYSFKGGVGRSMALANLAQCFYEKDLRVLVVDWDLEAPGIESYFYPSAATSLSQDGLKQVRANQGLMDLLLDYKQLFASLPRPAGHSIGSDAQPTETAERQREVEETAAITKSFLEKLDLPEDLRRVVAISEAQRTSIDAPPSFGDALDQQLPLDKYLFPIRSSTRGNLSLLTAGARPDGDFAKYASAVQEFDWLQLYAVFEGKQFFDWLRRKLDELADVVLIDSRTGVTEMGGVCTRQMSDVVVAFCAPNFQNVDGVLRVIRALDSPALMKARDDRELQTLVIPTRIDNNESALLGEFAQSFYEKVEKDGHPGNGQQAVKIPAPLQASERPMWNLRVPYVPLYNYRERLVFGPEAPADPPSEDLRAAYRKISANLAVLAPAPSLVFQRFDAEITEQFPSLRPRIAVSCVADDTDRTRLHQLLASRNLSVWPDLDHDEAEFRQQIDRAAILIVLLAPGVTADGQIRREVQYARQQGKAVYPVTPFEAKSGELPGWARRMVVFSLSQPEPLLTALSAPQKIARLPFMAPLPPAVAIQRTTPYERLRQLLESTATVSLSGAPGSGKSTLVAQVCQDAAILERFPDGVLWLDLGQAPNVALKWRELCTGLFGSASVPTDDVEIRRSVSSRLESGRFLLVLDDCWSEDLKGLPRPGPESALLTIDIRRRASQRRGAALVLGDLTEAEAVQLLTSDTPLLAADVEPILKAIGTSPIAASLARAGLQRAMDAGRTPGEAVTELETGLERHGVVALDDVQAGVRSRSIAWSIRTSLLLLDRADQPFLVALAELGQPELSLEEVQTVLHLQKQPPETTVDLLKRLDDLYFLEYDAKSRRARWNMLVWRYFRQSRRESKTAERSNDRRLMSSADWGSNPDVKQAIEILGTQEPRPHPEVYRLAKKLKAARYFEFARQLLALARRAPELRKDPKTALLYVQQQALCTSKNTQAPVNDRLQEALQLLRDHADLQTTTEPETLGIAGGICKEHWKYNGQRTWLERSLGYYLRGSERGVAADDGYTALNAAFILDMLANEEAQSGPNPTVAARRDKAIELRKSIVNELPGRASLPGNESLASQWWFCVTLGEAYFGLARYDEALHWLKEALYAGSETWEYETTARQLATLLVLAERRGISGDSLFAAQETLRVFLGNDAAVVNGVRLGRVGLALSGGGFRASLFHIGVLARLAELDFLRHVEVLSCVSGGSIIGAHYYLEVRKLLGEKPDHLISRGDYIEIVQRIEREFLAGVQRNVRTRVFTNPWISLKTAIVPGYSRTNRVGELYESQIYSRVQDDHRGPRYLNELNIHPSDEPQDFSPKLDNWRRAAKAPVLVLNATTLNTGHNWQFTVSWMGEPPASILEEIDSNDRLRRLYYWQAPQKYRRFRLGHAVAASSCVPGLFDPLALPNLYPSRTVQLVDGGVQDNQGTNSLIEQECTVMLVSDASGQMSTVRRPSTEILDVPLRSNSILQARVREAEYLDLHARRQSSLLRALLFVHLKKDLPVEAVAWIDEPASPRDSTSAATPYGVDTAMQEQLAAIRTDLDSFNDTEAAALMLSGYKMTEKYFAAGVAHAVVPAEVRREPWKFLELEPILGRTSSNEKAVKRTRRLLRVAGSMGFKAWRLNPFFLGSASLVGLTVVFALGSVMGIFLSSVSKPFAKEMPQSLVSGSGAISGWVLAVGAVGLFLATRRLGRLGFSKSLTQILIGLAMIPGALAAWLHLAVFDRLYLAAGTLSRAPRFERFKARVPFLALIVAVIGAAGWLFAQPWFRYW